MYDYFDFAPFKHKAACKKDIQLFFNFTEDDR